MNQGLLNSREVKAFDQLSDVSMMEEALIHIYTLLEAELCRIQNSYKRFLEGTIKKKDKKRAKVIVCVKPLLSLRSKVIERKKKLSEVKDLVRATILLDSADEVKKLYSNITRKKSEVVRCTHKNRGSDESFGYYGSYHIIFFYYGLQVELQIMTRKLWSYKAVAHEFYNKYREQENPSIDKFDLHLSKMIFSKGNKQKLNYKRSEIRQNYKILIPYFK